MKVLDSVRVLEIGGLGPGPFCAMHLADLGADVISVVRKGQGGAPTGSLLNRGKRSVFADLKTEEGRQLVLALVQDADALIEGMRPGVMERLGLGPEECMRINPRLVYGRMTGWGQSGPLAPRAGHDANYAAVSGALWGSSPADARPVSPFAVLGDIAGGAMYLMTGLLSGILQARATGRGTVVDAAIVDGAAHMLNLNLSARQRGVVADERGRSMYDSSPFYETYVCADGKHVTLGAIEPQFYALLLDTLGLAGDPDFAGDQWDKAAWPARRARLAALFLAQPRAHWQALLEPTDVCFGAVLSPVEAAGHPHMRARGVYTEHQGVLQVVPAPRFGGEAYAPGDACVPGAHTGQVLARLAEQGAKAVWRQ
ncbi:alpha-methylacyl-CoA racemase [Alicycliphilus denitrificans]|uniref:CaiB/BaiF CoA transferase family protein n=1 Tax=Alicycliphilus denitrificans TaxID=179636 RepID=UPI0009624B54|nr:CaiB/BaiF CoA-transferase family protein [Alicycliphilus denitrificans]MBN9573259.1 CoA transferase [Alicycliphilus denitrificans]OJW90730.1 MAG: CoA transferase [Alicycliphilus sp. 69-12]BCN36847.1 alpha-methylacyl-CoA racemase [Alicycliphilus denitrificans]